MSEAPIEGIPMGSAEDIAEGTAKVIEPQESGFPEPIAVFHAGEGCFFALNDICTHEEASLAEGWIEDGEVECPQHAARFDLRSGRALCLPATVDARTHKVEIRNGEIVLFPGVPRD